MYYYLFFFVSLFILKVFRIFLIQRYDVIDALFYDDATSNAKSSNYNNNDNTQTITYSENGTTITRTNESYNGTYSVLLDNSSTWRDSNQNYCIECDVIFENGVNGGTPNVRFGGGSVNLSTIAGVTSGNGHIKLETDGNTLTPYWNDVAVSSQIKTMSANNGFQLAIYHEGTLTFKNLVIYIV